MAGEIPRHAGQGRAEDERLHPRERVLQRIEKLKENLTIDVHRAGDVADSEDSGLPLLPLAPRRIGRVTTGLERLPHHRSQMNPRPAARWPPPPTRPCGEATRNLRRNALDLSQLVGLEPRQVALVERFTV